MNQNLQQAAGLKGTTETKEGTATSGPHEPACFLSKYTAAFSMPRLSPEMHSAEPQIERCHICPPEPAHEKGHYFFLKVSSSYVSLKYPTKDF